MFQSTHPRGVRPSCCVRLRTTRVFQSTHPRGVRRFCSPRKGNAGKFQSTHPRGVRPFVPDFTQVSRVFQSTHPRGVRLKSFQVTTFAINVSIHAPARGATNALLSIFQLPQFQSTHPRGVRPDQHPQSITRVMFQSTHPRGVRRSLPIYMEWGVCFNPRTREGCDGSDLTEFCHIRRFQSTHPRGVRLHKQVQIPLWSMFQSTHPRGVRLL